MTAPRRIAARWRFPLALLAALSATTALAELRSGQTVVIKPDEVVQGDLYAAGGEIRIDGTVTGDVVAIGGTVVVNGQVGGDILSGAGTTRINGAVKGSVRSMGGELFILGTVGEDAAIAGGRLTLARTAQIGRDAMLAGGEVIVASPIARQLRAAGGALTISSQVGGLANLAGDSITVTDEAKLDGGLTYRSRNEAKIASGAVAGAVTRIPLEQAQTSSGPFGFLYRWLRAVVAFCTLGLIIAFVAPRFTRTAPQTLERLPLRSFGYGAATLALAPFVAAILFMFGAVVGGWWLGLIAVGLILLAFAVSFPLVGYELGKLAFERLGKTHARRALALLAGIAVLTLAIRIPILGVLIALATVVFGFGALVLSALELRRQTVPTTA